MMQFVIDPANFTGSCKSILCDGKCSYTGKTEADFRAEGYDVLGEDAYHEYLTRWEDTLCGNWKAVSEEEYERSLNVLPPLNYDGYGFFVMERYTSDISAFYQRIGEKFYTSLQRWSTPRHSILESLRLFIEGGAVNVA